MLIVLLSPKSVRIPVQTASDSFLPEFLIFQIIVTVVAVTSIAELSVSETVTVQLQALRFCAVACFARP